jgi:acyl carrier protein
VPDDVTSAITEILDELGIEPTDIADSAKLGSDLALDSTDAVEVSLALKRRFRLQVRLQVTREQTVSELRDAVRAAMAGREPVTNEDSPAAVP